MSIDTKWSLLTAMILSVEAIHDLDTLAIRRMSEVLIRQYTFLLWRSIFV
jgi:hypothetical protein